MKTIAILSAQHQDVLSRLAAFDAQPSVTSNADPTALAAYLENEVVHHFTLEEHALFPVLAGHERLAHGPLQVMNSEHAEFRALLDRLRTAVRANDHEAQRAHTAELATLLRMHIMKEEHVLFPMAAQVLSADEQRDVDARAAELNSSS